jgi:uncharacterized protein
MNRSTLRMLIGVLLLAPPMAICQDAATPDESVLREYAGVYQSAQRSFLYLQLWNELAGTNQLVAFDESGEVRTLYPRRRDHFVAGPGAAVSTTVESRIRFQRNATGEIASLTWDRDGSSRTAERVEIHKREDVSFSNGDVQLAGTLISPNDDARHPAVILVHGSGPGNRESMVPFAWFLIHHGMAVFAYDKRGVGASTGNWTIASFDDLAGDVTAAFEYLKTRGDIDAAQIGLLGVSQAGWVMPLAANRARDIAFLISVSGPGVPAAETTIDHARNEMIASGMKPEVIEQIVGLMRAQYEFARTGRGWEAYQATRDKLVARLGRPPGTFPATRDDPYWETIRRLYFYDPEPTLRRLEVPTLALFGELDNNVTADKNKAAWDSALTAGGNRDYTSRVIPRANHIQLEANVGSNREMASLRRFAPLYFTTIRDWLSSRVRGFGAPTSIR